MEIEKKRSLIKRRGSVFFLARSISNWGYHRLTNVKTEFSEDLQKYKNEGAVFLYTGFHRSLWETTGVLSALHHYKLPIPLVGMGDNLIKGKFFVSLAKRTGSLFIVKRGKSRREVVESAKLLKKYVLSLMAYGRDTLLFPEGTRKNIPKFGKYGKFFPTAFDALLEYEKNKEDISRPDTEHEFGQAYIVPFNIDYSRIREAYELTGYNANIPRTLKIWDSIKMLKNIGNVYISFGKPIKISEHLDLSRKEISSLARNECLELVKILPVNIVAKAVINALSKNSTEKSLIFENIAAILDQLNNLRERFRGFTHSEKPSEIFAKVADANKDFQKISSKKITIYQLYSNYINHYFAEEKNVTKII